MLGQRLKMLKRAGIAMMKWPAVMRGDGREGRYRTGGEPAFERHDGEQISRLG